MQFKLSREQEFVRKMVREFEKEKNMDFTLKEEPFTWNENFSEIALEDFSMIQKNLSYGTAQTIGMALAKLELLEKQGCEVAEQKHGYWKLLDECSNAGVYCSVCHKKVYREDYANQKVKSNYCPNCGAKMELKGTEE